jgi:cold shock protein
MYFKYIYVSLINQNKLMNTGVMKFFNESKGYGFIIEDGNKKEHFVHISGVLSQIKEGNAVEFELREGKKGLNAVDVKVI